MPVDASQPANGAGPPIAPFLGYLDEAEFWVNLADPLELEAYCLATFKAMAPARQNAFLAFVTQKEVA